MKRILYLCVMMTLSMNMMAQIDPYDRNWDTILMENFNQGSTHWQWDTERFLNTGDYSWKAYIGTIAPKGEHEIYQFTNCHVNTTDNTMRLNAYYDPLDIQQNNYYLPKWMKPEFGGSGYPSAENRFYFSGSMEYHKQHYVQNDDDRRFQYGFFEIRCKLPTHKGAFPAFWLHNASKTPGNMFYEEIDVFEYSWWITSPSGPNHNTPGLGSNRCYTCGLYYNDTDTTHQDHSYGRTFPLIPNGSSSLEEFHTFGCEWLPDHVIWYFDGVEVNNYNNRDSIPHRPMILKINYAIDDYYNYNNTTWLGPGEMVIDHVCVYQLRWDCDNDVTIASQSDLNDFDYSVKKSITITSTIEEPIISDIDKVTFRVTDSFLIIGPFEVEEGGEFTVITQRCPAE